MPCPGMTFSRSTMSANVLLPWARSSATTCSLVAPLGRFLPSTPVKITSVAMPRILGPEDVHHDADDRQQHDQDQDHPLWRQVPEQPPQRRQEVQRLLDWPCLPPHAPAAAGGPYFGRSGALALPTAHCHSLEPSGRCHRPCADRSFPLIAHAAASSALSWESTIST